MKTSVVILNYNGEQFLQKYLPSIIEFSQNSTTEIVVADNKSTDNSLEVLKTQFPNIKTIELDCNYGFAEGYNRALQKLDSQYFVLCNSDVLLKSDAVSPLIKILENDSQTAVVMPKIKSMTTPKNFEYAGAAGGFIDMFGYPFCRGRILTNIEQDNGQYNKNCEIFWASGAFMAVRADIFKKYGGFDANFFAHMEEIDFCWRIKNIGYKIVYCADAEVFHLGGGTLTQGNPQKLFLNYRNSLKMLFKNLSNKKLFPILFIRMTLDGFSAVVYLLQLKFKYFWAVVKAHIALYANLKTLFKQRKELKKLIKNYNHKEILNGSIIFKCLIKKQTEYSKLKQ